MLADRAADPLCPQRSHAFGSTGGTDRCQHRRVLAARKLGMTEVPVIILTHLNANQKRAFMLADNRLALNAGWDEQMLQLELQALTQAGCNLEVTGFDYGELKRLLADLRQQALTDPDAAPCLDEEAVTEPGDLWMLGNHRLLCGDGTKRGDLERVLNAASSDMIFTDLPYNADYSGKTAQRLKLVNDNLGDQFSAFLQPPAKPCWPLTPAPSTSACHRANCTIFTRHSAMPAATGPPI
jgi:hypothetical protein